MAKSHDSSGIIHSCAIVWLCTTNLGVVFLVTCRNMHYPINLPWNIKADFINTASHSGHQTTLNRGLMANVDSYNYLRIY